METPAAAPARPKRIAILMPAGTISGRDRVSSYHHGDIRKIVDTDMNIGDTFVYESTLRLLDFDELEIVWGGGDIDRIVAQLDSCDVAVLRGSNYVHNAMQWGQIATAVERSRTPVVAFGIGAQAPRYEPVTVSDQTKRFLSVVSERSHSIGCRGAFTAQTLTDLGIKNAVPIGCPSIFRRNDRDLCIDLPPREFIQRIGFTSARGMSGMYCDAPARARVKQLSLMEELQRNYELYIITQSEKSEKIFYYRIYERIAEAKRLMRDTAWDLDRMPWLEKLYWSRIFFGTSPDDYERIMSFCDLAIGYRLHGNIMALSIGKPAIYHTFDSRTRELVEHFAIPSYDIMAEQEFDFEQMIASSPFDAFNQRFPVAYDLTRDFLDANGVPNRMSKPPSQNG